MMIKPVSGNLDRIQVFQVIDKSKNSGLTFEDYLFKNKEKNKRKG